MARHTGWPGPTALDHNRPQGDPSQRWPRTAALRGAAYMRNESQGVCPAPAAMFLIRMPGSASTFPATCAS